MKLKLAIVAILLSLQSCARFYSPTTGKLVAEISGDISKFKTHITKTTADIAFDSSSVSKQIRSVGAAAGSIATEALTFSKLPIQ